MLAHLHIHRQPRTPTARRPSRTRANIRSRLQQLCSPHSIHLFLCTCKEEEEGQKKEEEEEEEQEEEHHQHPTQSSLRSYSAVQLGFSTCTPHHGSNHLPSLIFSIPLPPSYRSACCLTSPPESLVFCAAKNRWHSHMFKMAGPSYIPSTTLTFNMTKNSLQAILSITTLSLKAGAS